MTETFQDWGMSYEWAWGLATLAGVLLIALPLICLLYTSPSPRDKRQSRMPSSA